MAVVRRNILSSTSLQTDFINGVKLLKQEVPSAGGLSTYDTLVVWHHRAMMKLTPTTQGERNAAHSGPVFFPWHRYMLILLERNLQRVLNKPTFGLPYWDWAKDGQLSAAKQKTAPIWGVVGRDGTPVGTGPFRAGQWTVNVEMDPGTGDLVSVSRPLNREFGNSAASLPKRAAVTAALAKTAYDTQPWNRTSAGSFRNEAEGWGHAAPHLHNLVHVWVGGDMLPSTSPNDPVFYLNHCNIDRLWATWQRDNGVGTYAPLAGDSTAPVGHRRTDKLFPLRSQAPRIADMFDVSSIYTYA